MPSPSDESKDAPSILIVEDNEELATAYGTWVQDDWTVEIANKGEGALDLVDEDTDVVLLDRDLPSLSGEEVLRELRDRGYDCWVAMLTGVEPDFDIIDMPFDKYLQKPVTKETLRSAVEELYARSAYDEQVRELFAIRSKVAELRVEKHPSKLEKNEEYQQLVARAEELESNLDEQLQKFDGFEGVFKDFSR